MRILIDIGHPAHVHYFRNAARILLNREHKIVFTARDKEVSIDLLNHYGFNYINLGKPFKSVYGKLWGLIYFTYKVYLVALKFKPDIFLNATMYSAIVSRLFRKPHISLEDTFNMEQVKLYLPFTKAVLTCDYFHPGLGEKEVRYDGYQELAYLNPKYFKPDREIIERMGIKNGEKYVILRFVSWAASHDFRHSGISIENKIKAVKELSKYAKVFISSESKLPCELEKYRIKIPPYKMHDAIAGASLLYGESATMASEAAMLSTPAIFLDNKGRYYSKDQEKRYGLVFNYTESLEDQEKSIIKGIELLRSSKIKYEFEMRKNKMLQDKIDLTAFMVWFIENYPESHRIMKQNPDYQYRFK